MSHNGAMATGTRNPILSPWDLAAAAGVAGLSLYYRRILPRLPDPVPTHFDALGHPNGWTAKAHLPWVVFGILLLPWLVLLAVAAAQALAPPRADGTRKVSLAPMRGLLGLGMALLMGAVLTVPLQGLRCLVIGLAAFLACLVPGLALVARASAAGLAGTPQEGHYRWGLVYVNPEDPRLWVEKRVGVGWTLNYGRPAAYWITALLVSPVFLALGAALLGRPR